MSDETNQPNSVPDTYGGASRRVSGHMPTPMRPVPSFADDRDKTVMADSDKMVEQLRTTIERQIKPAIVASQTITSPLKEIATRIKKLIHDDGETFGNELTAKMVSKDYETAKAEVQITMAKALQLWADDQLKTDKTDKPESGS